MGPVRRRRIGRDVDVASPARVQVTPRNATAELVDQVVIPVDRERKRELLSHLLRSGRIDQALVFTAVGSYDLGAGFDIGSRFRYSTGYPRTPVKGATYDARVDGYFPLFGPQNGERIPEFYALDVRLAKRFKLGSTVGLETYLDVQNVTNHQNPEEIVYNFNYKSKSYITGLPILPVIGGKLTW